MSRRRRRAREKQLRHAFREAAVRPRALAAGSGLAVAATLVTGSTAQAVSAVFEVDMLADTTGGTCTPMPDDCSLRDAINQSNAAPGSTITFASGVTGTIHLGGLLPYIQAGQTIEGPGPKALTIATSYIYKALPVQTDAGDVEISGLTVTGGQRGIFTYGSGALSISNVALVDNEGEGVSSTDTPTLIENSTISGNEHGVLKHRGALTIRNSTIADNTSTGVGTLGGSDVTLENSTVSGNATGVDMDDSNLTLDGSIVAANDTDVNGSDTAALIESHSLIEGASGIGSFYSTTTDHNLNGVDPKLGPVADNGGPTETMKPAAGSPVLDKGKDYTGTGKDQRGESIYDRPGIANAADGRDMGAFELQALAPAISSISPTHGLAGNTVTITGTDFTGATAVKFGTTDATFNVDNDEQITATVPAGSGDVDVAVTAPNGTSADTAADNFHYIAQPAVTLLSPDHGNPGRTVTINGSEFTTASAVKFGTADATSFNVDSDTQITATVPAGTGTVDVRVTNPAGTSGTGTSDQFTYSAPIEVDTLADDGDLDDCTDGDDEDCSLRGAIVKSNDDPFSTITFASGVTGTIALGSPLPTIQAGQTIDGPGPDALTVSAPYGYTAQVSTDGGAVSLSGLTIRSDSNGIGIQASGSQQISISNAAITDSGYGLRTYAPTVVDHSTVSGNSGGIKSLSTLTVSSSTIADNPGYGVQAYGPLTLENSTVSGSQRGIVAVHSAMTLRSSIVGGNSNADITAYSSSTLTENFSLIQNSAGAPGLEPGSGDNLNNMDPQLLPLADNGGPTQTVKPRQNSPAVDKGKDYTTTGKDQRGEPIYDRAGVDNAADGRDIGAVELPAPFLEVASVSPGRGHAGDTVTITGTKLTGATAVKFGTTDATDFTVVSDTEITATAPAGTGTVDVTVTTASGTSATTADDKFHYVGPPAVSSLSPDHGNPGRTVTITGLDFTDASAVKFGTTDATDFDVDSDTQITATVPAGSGTVHVRVTTPEGTSDTGSSDQFTYSAPIEVDTRVDDGALDDCTDTDDEDCSLRGAITKANSDPLSTITFASNVTGTIKLASPLPDIHAGEKIEGPGPQALSVKAASPTHRVLDVDSSSAGVSVSGLTVTGGRNGISTRGPKEVSISDVAAAGNTTGLYANSPVVVEDSTVSGNKDGVEGGDLTILNSTVAGNTRDGIRTSGLALKNSTVSGNATGINTAYSGVTIQSSIVAGNQTQDINRFYAYITENFSLIQNDAGLDLEPGSGDNLNGQDPQLGPLADNGGDTKTMKPAASSPVIDKGKDFVGSGKDQRGEALFDDPDMSNAADGRDIGAVELHVSLVQVESVSPGRGNAGDTVTITGTNFNSATGVKFGSTDATDFDVVSDTKITATVPPGSGTVNVRVTYAGGASEVSGADKFLYIGPPEVSSLAPDHGAPGSEITITGVDFTGATAVKFGTTDATHFTVDSDTQITATVPEGPAGGDTVHVRVTTPKGTSDPGSDDAFTYLRVFEVDTLEDDASHQACAPEDDDDCSLRGAIIQANDVGSGLITFASDVTGTIELGNELPRISAGETIEGPGAKKLTIDGSGLGNDVLRVNSDGGDVSISGLTVTGGYHGITASGAHQLTVSNAALTDSYLGLFSFAPTVVRNSTVTGTAQIGLFTYGSSLSVENSTVAGNASNGVGARYGSLTLKNSTVGGNSGAGVYSYYADVTLQGSVVAGNDGGDIHNQYGAVTENLSLIEDTAGLPPLQPGSGDNLNGEDPDLGPLADNGGATETMRPAADSPVVDSGKDYVGSGEDQRGATTFDWPDVDNAADARDMGAFELQGAPTISSVSPGAGNPGDTATITGAHFTNVTGVKFGSTDAADLKFISDTKLTVTVPAGADTADVRVTTPEGTSENTAADNFHYLAPPTVTGLSPDHGSAGDTVTITGTKFTGATGVKFGSADATDVVVVNSTQITAKAPAGSGTVDVRVTTPDGTSANVASDDFTYDATPPPPPPPPPPTPPAISSLSPNRGSAGDTVTITGTNLTGATAVKFGTADATDVVVVDATHITAKAPGGSGTVDVTVTNPDGTSANTTSDDFTYDAAPPPPPPPPAGLTDRQVRKLLGRPLFAAHFVTKPKTLVFRDRMPEAGKLRYRLLLLKPHAKGKDKQSQLGTTVVRPTKAGKVKVTIHLGDHAWLILRENPRAHLALQTSFRRKLNHHLLKVTRRIRPKNRPKG